MKRKKVIIIGSGLCGPLLSIMLAKRGFKVKLIEKLPDIRKSDIYAGRSINLALSHRGIRALIDVEVFDMVKSSLIPMRGRRIHHLDGRAEYQPYSVNPSEHINSVSREGLTKCLMTAAETTGNVDIVFDSAIKSIDMIHRSVHHASGTFSVDFPIFGTDGAGSVVRNTINELTGQDSMFEPLGHGYKELTILAEANNVFKLEKNALHIWPRGQYMLIALPNVDGSFTCTLFLPNTGDPSFESLNSPAQIHNFFTNQFPDVVDLLHDLENTFINNPVGTLGTVYTDNWHWKDELCLLGDAAHAVVPFFGQGMNASFEDCTVLAECIDEVGGDDWGDVFSMYRERRKVDGDAIARMAIENYIEMRDSVAQPDYLLKKKISNQLAEAFPDRFIPRYSMVSFTSIPYHEVYKRGEIQTEIIDKLVKKAESSGDLDMELAGSLINEKLSSVVK
jgi:kynurenine 3-monooxygenase